MSSKNANQVIYAVKWDPERRLYVVLDDSGTALRMSEVKGVVMELARTAAIAAANERGVKITVMVEDDGGTLKKQWTFAPRSKSTAT